MALPEVKNLKNARYLIGYKATLKSMRPDCIQDLFPQWNWSCRKTGHKQRQKKHHYNYLQQLYAKNVHPVYSAEIQTFGM